MGNKLARVIFVFGVFVGFLSLDGAAMKKNIVLIIASNGFQPKEYGDTRAVLEKNGYTVTVASDKTGKAVDGFGEMGPEVGLSVKNLNVADYAGIFIIGGMGAMELLDNERVYAVMRAAQKAGLVWGAICISPRILCAAGLLDNKKITGWDGDHKLKSVVADKCLTAQVVGGAVVVDGKLVTGSGPGAATEFGQAIVTVLNQQHDQ